MAEHQLGTAFLSEGIYPAANYHLSEAYRLNQSYVPTMFNLAIIYKKNGDNINTLRMLREAARFSPKDIEIKYSLFRIYKNMGDTASAMHELVGIAEVDPKLAAELTNK